MPGSPAGPHSLPSAARPLLRAPCRPRRRRGDALPCRLVPPVQRCALPRGHRERRTASAHGYVAQRRGWAPWIHACSAPTCNRRGGCARPPNEPTTAASTANCVIAHKRQVGSRGSVDLRRGSQVSALCVGQCELASPSPGGEGDQAAGPEVAAAPGRRCKKLPSGGLHQEDFKRK